MSERRIVHLVVRGRVQGVGFRAFVEETAFALGLQGWVRNRRDGSIETVAAGPREAVDAFVEAVRRGPRPARVDAVKIAEIRRRSAAPGAGRLRFIANRLAILYREFCRVSATLAPLGRRHGRPVFRLHLR
jgi:acylphosphatase